MVQGESVCVSRVRACTCVCMHLCVKKGKREFNANARGEFLLGRAARPRAAPVSLLFLLRLFLSLSLRSLHPRLLRVHTYVRTWRPVYGPRDTLDRGAAGPVGERLPTCTPVISRSPPEGYRIWIYLPPRFILAHYSLTHTHTHTHTYTHAYTRIPDSPVIICTAPRVSPRVARLCIFSVGREYASTPPSDADAALSRLSRGFRDMRRNGCSGRSVRRDLPLLTCRL